MARTPALNNKRKISGLISHPAIQFKFVLLFILFSGFLLAATSYFLYINFFRFFELLLEFNPIKEDLQVLLSEKISETFQNLLIGLVFYFFGVTFLTIYFSHKIVGPTKAFRRHIHNLSSGEYKSRVNLRKFDAFQELADDLNQLAKKLDK